MEISIQNLFEKYFGVPGTSFNPQFGPVQGDNAQDYTDIGFLGTKYYDSNGLYLPVTLTYTNSDNEQQTYELPYPVISIKGKKHVIDTELTERRGRVSELINTESYSISIKGFLINKDANRLPENDVQDMRDCFECGTPMSIKNVLTDLFLLRPDSSGTDLVTVRDFELPYSIGVKHVKAYTLELVSEEPFNLIQLSGN